MLLQSKFVIKCGVRPEAF